MAVKKTVKKRRAAKKATVAPIEKIIEALQADAKLSAVNKRAVTRLNRAVAAVARQEKQLQTGLDRVSAARAAVGNAKTPAAKQKAKAKLATAQEKSKELRAARSAATAEQKKAERLARGLQKALATAQGKMAKAYDKTAQSLEKAVDKPVRRRRTSRRKTAAKAD